MNDNNNTRAPTKWITLIHYVNIDTGEITNKIDNDLIIKIYEQFNEIERKQRESIKHIYKCFKKLGEQKTIDFTS